MAKKNTTVDKDKGAKHIVAQAKRLKGSYSEIGVQETGEVHMGGDGDGLVTVAEIAFWNEFGTVTAPERSFIRSTVDENRPDLNRLVVELLRQIIDGKIDTKKALDKLGFKIQELIKKKILELNTPPNAASTVARKGFNNPLVDSRQLWRSIAHKATLKGAA